MPPLYHFPLSCRHGDRSSQEFVQTSPQLASGLITLGGFSLTIAGVQVRRTSGMC